MEFSELDRSVLDLFPSKVSIISADCECQALKVKPYPCSSNLECKWSHSCSDRNFTKEWKIYQKNLFQILQKLGHASSVAQGLSCPVTTAEILVKTNHRVYILKESDESPIVIGFIKIGEKPLYLTDEENINVYNGITFCVLDFYIHESCQRMGFGYFLFCEMLKAENVSVEEIAIDNPSIKLISFLKKHFSLNQPCYHHNKFVTFPEFFQHMKSKKPDDSTSKSRIEFDSNLSTKNSRPVFTKYNSYDASSHQYYFANSVIRRRKSFYESEPSWRILGIEPPNFS